MDLRQRQDDNDIVIFEQQYLRNMEYLWLAIFNWLNLSELFMEDGEFDVKTVSILLCLMLLSCGHLRIHVFLSRFDYH
ncbi:MAG: hypothetical protein H8D23_40110 [Candidatus Brocadiales bacterium]|nr:hypothetical protein [Candidatus Brocadiales bacterium]